MLSKSRRFRPKKWGTILFRFFFYRWISILVVGRVSTDPDRVKMKKTNSNGAKLCRRRIRETHNIWKRESKRTDRGKKKNKKYSNFHETIQTPMSLVVVGEGGMGLEEDGECPEGLEIEKPTSIFQSPRFRRNRCARFVSIPGRTSSLADDGTMESRHRSSGSFFPSPLWLPNSCRLRPPRTLNGRPRSRLRRRSGRPTPPLYRLDVGNLKKKKNTSNYTKAVLQTPLDNSNTIYIYTYNI